MTDFRALCEELVDALKDENTYTIRIELIDRARAALAEQPVEPTDEDLYDLAEVFNGEPVAAMRRALELWGTPAIQPVPVTPTDEELDEFAVFWWGSDTDERTVTDVIECCSMAAFARAVLARWGQP